MHHDAILVHAAAQAQIRVSIDVINLTPIIFGFIG